MGPRGNRKRGQQGRSRSGRGGQRGQERTESAPPEGDALSFRITAETEFFEKVADLGICPIA